MTDMGTTINKLLSGFANHETDFRILLDEITENILPKVTSMTGDGDFTFGELVILTHALHVTTDEVRKSHIPQLENNLEKIRGRQKASFLRHVAGELQALYILFDLLDGIVLDFNSTLEEGDEPWTLWHEDF